MQKEEDHKAETGKAKIMYLELQNKYKQLQHDYGEVKALLEAKISDEINFDRGKQKYDREIKDLKKALEEMKIEVEVGKRDSMRLSQELKNANSEINHLNKIKKGLDVKLAEYQLKSSSRPELQETADIELLQTRLASEAYENRQLRAQLKKLASGKDIVPGDLSDELLAERAANKRLEKLNIDLQKELLYYKNNSRESRGLERLEEDYKSKYQLAEIKLQSLEDKLKISRSGPLKDRTQEFDSQTNIEAPEKDPVIFKQENLRLSSMLNESQTKLRRLQMSNAAKFAQQEQSIQLNSKLQILTNKNQSLQESLDFYKTRAENYYSKIEAAEVAVQTVKRAEELLRNELSQTKQMLAKAQQEYRNSDLTVAKLNTQIRDLERDLSDKVFELRKLQEMYDALKDKHENAEELRLSSSSNQADSKDREIKLLNDDLLRLMDKETELNKQIKNVTMQLESSKKEVRTIKFSNSELLKENEQFKRALTETMYKNDKLTTERQEHLMRMETLTSQVKALKTSNEDLLQERDNLLESKRELEVKVSEITAEFDKYLAKAKDDAENAATVVQLRGELEKTSREAMDLKERLQQHEGKLQEYEAQMADLQRDSLMVIEENKALTKFNKQLKTKLDDMILDHQKEMESERNHWTARVQELEEKIYLHNATKREKDQKFYNLERLVKDYEHRNEIQTSTIERYKDDIKNLEETVTRLDSSLEVLQQKEYEATLRAKRALRELDDSREKALLLERELLDWRTTGAE
ncbi:hypothetical protein KL930_000320 [Ogataea haglerorum]|uniref:Uncharacterized protein n=1 Tax=Ogataea haglerorum TaxID=1937702 RepID=A0AAN6D4T4_9ASCO|nr:uncharacterized protein KL911_000811 [Ogataea haglerorum]KAG7697625.1 hypothetical protein KL951_002199 [Ogataea haglerorum]KAG7701226.1 hypothetical protein KL915_000257 [Ogataea haglerorum]KAG7709184.1 hypothetical protein KL914_001574 [Ogataea haglerorum]KAG7715312.1 hypothetical protein KL913_004144 [Ogataea haglerorum]KAG7715809.1 hypothetical protein KL949_004226 [Ogataea haglerorum]